MAKVRPKKTRASKRREERRRVSARRRTKEHRTQFDSTTIRLPDGWELFKVEKPGVKKIDILPFRAGKGNPYAEEGEPYFERTYFVHRDVGADSRQYVCPLKTANKRCPICEYRGKLVRDPDADEDYIASLAPKERQLWIVRDLSQPDGDPMLWDVSYHLFGKLLDVKIRNADEEDGYDLFADPEEGFTLRVVFEEKKFGGFSFFEAADIEFKPRKRKYSPDIVDEMPCLDDLLVIFPYDKLKAIFLQAEEDPVPEDDEAEDSEPERTKSKKRKRLKPEPKPEPEDDEDELDDGFEDDEDLDESEEEDLDDDELDDLLEDDEEDEDDLEEEPEDDLPFDDDDDEFEEEEELEPPRSKRRKVKPKKKR